MSQCSPRLVTVPLALIVVSLVVPSCYRILAIRSNSSRGIRIVRRTLDADMTSPDGGVSGRAREPHD